jgi:ADP-heptose:LPS heptosyltransferase
MISLLFLKIKNLIVFIFSYLIISFLQLQKIEKASKTLLLIRLDEIGDFVLFCNFITVVKTSKKFKDYKISLVGNEVWRDLAESFFSREVERFIWINKNRFYSNPIYKYEILKRLYQSGFEVVINPLYSRGILYDDLVVKASAALTAIGSEGSLEKYAKWKREFFTDRYYTELIPQSSKVIFEFTRNLYFFEKVLEEPIKLDKPTLNPVEKISFNLPEQYVIIFPGAGEEKRMWNILNFTEITRYILNKHKLPVLLCGSQAEIEKSQFINQTLNNDQVYDLTGKTSLTDFINIIAKTALLISNDSSAPHIAVSVNIPFVCIANGKTLGRFSPYPTEIFTDGHYIYPPEIMENRDKMDELTRQYQFDSDLDINEITVDQVKKLIDNCLGNQT